MQAHAQAPIEYNMNMELPPGIKTKYKSSQDYILKLLAHLYSQKQAGQVWNQNMVDKLRKLVSNSTRSMNVSHYHDDIVFIVYIDDGLFFGSYDDTLTLIIKQLKDCGLNIKDQGHPADYIRVNIKKTCEGSNRFTQHTLIDTTNNSYTKPVPAKVSLQLDSFHNHQSLMGTSTIAQLWAS
jgi:hypothetical protein